MCSGYHLKKLPRIAVLVSLSRFVSLKFLNVALTHFNNLVQYSEYYVPKYSKAVVCQRFVGGAGQSSVIFNFSSPSASICIQTQPHATSLRFSLPPAPR
jgi:hypothetical protein